jgi:hypothetical protein
MPGDDLAHGPPATKKAGGSYHRFGRINRHSLRDGVNGLYRARLGETGFCVTVACASSKRNLSTCHEGARPTRLGRPLPALHVRQCVSRPSHSASTSVTTRPSLFDRGGMRGGMT